MPGMQEQPFAISAVGHFIAKDTHQSAALVLAHPGKAQRLAGLLLVIEQGAATGVQRAQRRQVWRGDVQQLAHVTQQHGRHSAHAVQRPAAHADDADVQRQAQLVVVAAPARDQFELGTTEAEEGLQFELGELTRQVDVPGSVPASLASSPLLVTRKAAKYAPRNRTESLVKSTTYRLRAAPLLAMRTVTFCTEIKGTPLPAAHRLR